MLDQLEEKEEVKVGSFAVKQGIYLGLMLIIFSIFLFATGLSMNQGVASISYLILIGVLVWSMMEFKKANEGFMTFGEGLGLGALTTLIGSAISSGFSVFYINVIDPGYVGRVLERSRMIIEEQYPQLSDEQIDNSLKFSEAIMQPLPMFFIGLIVFSIAGMILSLIIAAIMQKRQPNPF